MRRQRFSRARNVTKIRLVIFVERSGNADDDRIHLLQLGVIRGCGESLTAGFLNFRSWNPENIRAAGSDSRNFSLIYIETGDWESLFTVKQRKRKPYVTQANDCNTRLALLNLAF